MIGPSEQDMAIGVVICDGGGPLAQSVDFDGLAGRLRELSQVVDVKRCAGLGAKSDGIEALKELSKRVGRVVVAGSSLETSGPLWAEAISKSKINVGLAQAVNIAEQCGRVHKDGTAATDKAYELISAAVRRLAVSEAIKTTSVRVCHDVAVIGGGVAGMQSAAALAQLGHEVTLINSEAKLGGTAAKMPELYGYLADDAGKAEAMVRETVAELIDKVTGDEAITVCAGATLKSVKGQLGDFAVEVVQGGKKGRMRAGAVVLACGLEAKPAAKGGCVDLAGLMKIVGRKSAPRRIAIVMDMGTQQGRAACAQALSAAEMLAGSYGAQVKLYCDNIRVAAAGMERLYRRARDAGMTLAKTDKPPKIAAGTGKTTVSAFDPIVGAVVDDDFDLVVMADAESATGDGISAVVEGLRVGPSGGQQYDDVWLGPIETNRRGIYAVGAARGNSELREAIADGVEVAEAIHELLGSGKVKVAQDSAVVDPEKCVQCLTCLRICPHGAIGIDVEEEAASVSAIACQRCGVCAAECPATAIQLGRYSDEQVGAEIGSAPVSVVFACENSADQAATAAGVCSLEYQAQVRIVRVPCAGKVDPRDVLKALADGAPKVAVIGCHPESCRYLTGSSRAERRVKRMQEMLAKVGIDESRVFFGGTTALEPRRFVEYVTMSQM